MANGKLVHNSEKLNLQNLGRGSELRRSLCSHPDERVYVADSSNIEARMLAWEAGHEALLEQFRAKQDVYSNFASSIYNKPINKHDHPLERFIGKTCVLGLGYQVGWRKLQASLATSAEAVFLDDAETQRIVNLYRTVNAPIPNYWRQAEVAIADMYLGNTRSWGPLTIHKNCLVLPNGMALQYPGLRPMEQSEDGMSFGGWEYWNGKFWTNLYGGKLTENITQALARIVLFDQMLQINDMFAPHGGRVVLNVHDEIVAIGPAFGGDESAQEELFESMLAVMRQPPAWCSDLPLDGEGGVDVNYSK